MKHGSGHKSHKYCELSQEERDLFQEAMKTVKPLKQPLQKHFIENTRQNRSQYPESTLKLRRQNASVPEEKNNHLLLRDIQAEPVSPEEFISFRHESLSLKLFNSLKNSKFPIERCLDLHGYTIDEARERLIRFIDFSQQKKYRSLRVIHGKSSKKYQRDGITLKSRVACWLTQIPSVLGYCSCLPKDGGTGAVYVLLRRSM
ncbi:MAG: Smr/MutS family protein [Endozoicomonadaceae bacterium]|nr:Smr/MutS family protein [Endozoicomonadaceae bacterium]MCY4330776.1 Smr/MutS family protein [Endozoicomonadaceae bacterium]